MELRVSLTDSNPSGQAKKPLVAGRHEDHIDTTLIPPGTQYGETHSKPEKENPFRNAGFAGLYNPQQRLSDHS